MTDRIRRLREHMVTGYAQEVRCDKMRITLETEKAMQGQPRVLQRSESIYNVGKKIPIHIMDDELIVGTPASAPWSLEVDSCLGIWDKEEIDALRDDGFTVSEETEKELLKLNEDFHPFGLWQGCNLAVRPTDRLENFVRTGILLAPWKGPEYENRVGGGNICSGLGLGPGWILLCIDYEMALNKGFRMLIEEINAEIQNNEIRGPESFERSCSLQAMRRSLEGVIIFANRHADLAAQMAEECADPVRKKELQEISEICRRVPEYAPRTFREAIQFVWFIMEFSNPCPTAPYGRFDQYMYPYYKADIENGRISDAEVIELLDCLRIRTMELNSQGGKQVRKRAAGSARWYNMTIGGVKPDGTDATNELSYLVLDAVMDCPCIQHTVTIRVSGSTPKDLIAKGVECQARGLSMPAFVGDNVYIDYFTTPSLGDNGLPLEDARDFCITGCIDGNIPGRTRSILVSMFILPLTLDIFLNQGKCKNTGVQVGHPVGDLDQFETYEDFETAYLKELEYYIGLGCELSGLKNLVFREQSPMPFRTALMRDGIKDGREMMTRTYPFENSSVLNAVGGVNLAQSLYAIKDIVFDKKMYTLSQLKEILDANWEDHEDLRQYCVNLPHYGNDIDDIDSWVAKVYQYFHETVTKFPASYGGYFRSTAISVTSHAPGGALTGATPDGRYAKETLADACASPMRGYDTEGPISVFKSAMKIDASKFQAFLMNMKFSPSALKTKEDKGKLVAALQTFLTHGGSMVQFNVVDKNTLLEAKAHKDEHRDLMVRVAGYSAYFVNLNDQVMNEVIDRTEQNWGCGCEM